MPNAHPTIGLVVPFADHGLKTLNVAAPLEARFGLPVVSSTPAAFWAAMRLAGQSGRLEGHGRMLAAA